MRLRLALPLLVTALIAFLFVSVRVQRCESVQVVEFSENVPYLEALALLGNKSNLERLVGAAGVEVTGREWDEFDLGRRHKFSSWEASGRGRFEARSLSGDFRGEMTFLQVVRASREGMEVRSEMSSPCGYVKSHVAEVRVVNSRPVVVRVESRIVYERPLPFWLADRMRTQVGERNKSRAEAVAAAIGSILRVQPEKTAHQ